MSLSVAPILLIVVAMIISLRYGLFPAGGLLLPFGSASIISGSSASVNVADVYFLLICGLFVVVNFSLSISRSHILPIVIAVLCAMSALIYPRIFSGLMVIPVNGVKEGVLISDLFRTSVSPLEPSSGNISQFFYVTMSMFYLMVFASFAHRSSGKIHMLLTIAALSNLVISISTMAFGPEIWEPFRTADFRQKYYAEVAGVVRLIGLFPEASRFADFTAPLGAYFVVHYIESSDRRSLFFGLTMTGLAVMALSSTGLVAVGVAGLYALVISGYGSRTARRMAWLIAPVLLILIIIAVVMPGLIGEVVQRLLLDKSGSSSGLERGAWSVWGWNTFIATYGLGAGTGSVRSNGMLFVWLSNVGILGTFLFGLLVWRSLNRRSDTPIMRGLTAAIIAILAARMISQTTISPGIFFAILVGAKMPLFRELHARKNASDETPIMSQQSLSNLP